MNTRVLKATSAAVAFLVPCVIYFAWLPRIYTGDDLQQAMQIEQRVTGVPFYHPSGGRLYEPGLATRVSDRAKQTPVNPRYLLELPTMVAVAGAWRAAGWDGHVLLPIASLHAIVGALGILAFYFSLVRLRGRRVTALVASLGLGTTYGYWSYSTGVDQSISMAALLCLALYVLVGLRPAPGWRGLAALAGVLALATLYNSTAALAVPAFAVSAALMTPHASRWTRIRQAAAVCLLSAAIAVTVTLLVIASPAPARVLDRAYWDSVLFAGRPEYSVDPGRDILRAALGFARSQVTYPGLMGPLRDYWEGAGRAARAGVIVYFGAILAVMMMPALRMLWQRRRLAADERWLHVLLPLWFAPFAAFNVFWDPGFVKYWLVPLLPVWFGFGLFIEHAGAVSERRRRLALSATALCIVVAFAVNLSSQFLPASRRSNNPWLPIAEALRESRENDLFVSDGHPLELYIAYLTHRNVVSKKLITYANQGSEEAFARVLSEQVRRHRADGGAVYLFSAQPGGTDQLARDVGLPSADGLEARWRFTGVTIYRADLR